MSQEVDIRCPACSGLLLRRFDGNKVQAYCKKCKLEVYVKRRVPVPTIA